MRKPTSIIAALVLLAFSLASCVTPVSQKVAWTPLPKGLPTSASKSIRLPDGRTIAANQYQVLKEFSFPKNLELKLRESEAVPLQIEAELRAVMAESGADAIAELKITPIGVDSSSILKVGTLRNYGLIAVLVSTLAYFETSVLLPSLPGGQAPAAGSTDPMKNLRYLALGGAAIGGGLFGGSYLVEKNAAVRYSYMVSGKAVKIVE